MSEWQPIETAPKDGTVILAWRKYGSIPKFVRFDSFYGEWEVQEEGWHVHNLTHWMPIPEPPK
jgi:hypothetical protein